MKHNSTPRISNRLALVVGGALLAFGCNNASSSFQGPLGTPGTVVETVGGDSSQQFFVEASQGGFGQTLRITGMWWGRAVDVFGLNAIGQRHPVLQQKDFVINGSIDTSPDYTLEINPVTDKATLVILRDVTTAVPLPGQSTSPRDQFFELLRAAGENLSPIFDLGINGNLFSMVPRNSAIVVRFDDLIDPTTVTAQTIGLFAGDPAVTPFEARIFVDPNYGDMGTFGGATEFYSTRVVIDTTISEIESFETDPPLQPNGVGFPPSINVNLPNVVLRIPSQEAPLVGQTTILRNPSGHHVTTAANGSVDFASPSADLLRAMRSGGNSEVTGDAFNGFLPDNKPPQVVGAQAVAISATPFQTDPVNDPRAFIIPQVQFLSTFCAQTPSVGDVFEQSGFFAEVAASPAPHSGGLVSNLQVRLLLGDPGDWVLSAVGAAQFLSTFDEIDDAGKAACFVRITPTPSGFPLNPTVGIATDAELGIRFSEAMDPTSMTAFDSLTLTRVPVPATNGDYVVGNVDQSSDLREFRFVSDLLLAHQGPPTPAAEPYYLTLASGGGLAPTDLAGNALTSVLPQVMATIDPNASTQVNGGRVTRFTDIDEEAPFGDDMTGPMPEFIGQHLFDGIRQLIKPRPVVRYEAVHDRSQAIPAILGAAPLGVQTPLSNLGSRTMTVVRYADVGFDLTDPSNLNIDVEGLNWAPVGGQVVADNFTNFEISMSHSRFLPDEVNNPLNNNPVFPNSGLVAAFTNNLADPNNDPLVRVHPKERGYIVSPGDLFASTTGTLMMPYPLNRGIPQSEYRHYTWRDTSLLVRAGINGAGIEFSNNVGVLGLPPEPEFAAAMVAYAPIQGPGDISTLGLPLLLEFKTYPDGGALGLNSFDVSFNTGNGLAPFFRAFSTGGTDTNSQIDQVEPDLEDSANGGFNPLSTPVPGVATPGLDDTFYIGSMDLVVRVSRTYSVWFGTAPSGILIPSYNPAVTEPSASELPEGTAIQLAFRGALNITANQADYTGNAATLDPYGDWYQTPFNDVTVMPPALADRSSAQANVGLVPLGDLTWKDDISLIDGAQFYQMRLTFIANPETGLVPELSAVGNTWTD